jgi:hypothetical protein
MPGFHYVLSYDQYGNYTGTSIQPNAQQVTNVNTVGINGVIPVGVIRDVAVPVVAAVPVAASSSPGMTTQNFTWKVGQVVNQISGTGVMSGTLPPGIVHTSTGYFTGTPTTPGAYAVILTWSSGPYYLVNMTVTGTAIVVPLISTPVPTVTNLMNWISARDAARGGKKIRRNIWSDHFLTFENYLFWLQIFDATTKVLGARRVVLATDFGMTEFQAVDWTTDGIADQNSAASSVGWSYAPATSDHLLTDSGDTITTDTNDPITQ